MIRIFFVHSVFYVLESKKNFRVNRKFFKNFFFQNLLNVFWKIFFLKIFRITLKFFFTSQYIKNWMDKKKFRITFVSKKKLGSLRKISFENFMMWGPKGGILIFVENGPLGCYLWCCGGRLRGFLTFFQIAPGHTVMNYHPIWKYGYDWKYIPSSKTQNLVLCRRV